MVSNGQFQALMGTEEIVPPPEDIVAADAYVKDWDRVYKESLADPEGFWEKVAREFHWYRDWDQVLDWQYPYAKWFVGGQTNITYNCLDRHVNSHRKNKVALIWESEEGEERIFTYRQLLFYVNKFANALKSIGIGKGDRVIVYMPLTPEGIMSMLACARIGAVHSVVYAGLGHGALRDRIVDAGAKAVICSDIGYRRGREIALLDIVRNAVEGLDEVEGVIVHRRREEPMPLGPKEHDLEELMAQASHYCEAEIMDTEDLLFILYTSGTTGKPKGTTFAHGGYMVGTAYHAKAFMNISDKDVYWSTSDIGWIVGHSYIVYAPLTIGATCFVREGAPDYPDPGAFYHSIEKHGISRIFTAPTLIRMLMRYGVEWTEKYDLSTIRQILCAGEPMNPEAWWWGYRYLCGNGKAWLCDNMWQTETGAPLVCTPLTKATKPGYCGVNAIGIDGDVVNDRGEPVAPGEGGNYVVKNPWPSMFTSVYNDPERYEEYWNSIPGCYVTGDVATRDEEGYIMFLGRSDDILNPAGHRIGTADVESALVSHPAVAEAAVIGKPDPIKGESIKAFVILRMGYEPTQELSKEINLHVRGILGPIAAPNELQFVDSLPKTRSGKIMRRLLKAQELGLDIGDISTLEE